MTSTHHRQKGAPIIVALLMPCLLAACANQKSTREHEAALASMQRNGASPQAQDKFKRDQKLTVATGMVAGRVIGGVTVAALGNRLGPLGQVAVILGGALVGGAIGGHWVGELVARKKALAQTTEANLDAAIKESQAENVAVRKRVSMLRSQLLEHKKRIAIANVQHNTKELAKIKGELKTLDQKLGGEVASYDQGIGLQQQIFAKVPTTNSMHAKLGSTLNESKVTRGVLESQRKEVASLMNSLSTNSKRAVDFSCVECANVAFSPAMQESNFISAS